MRPASAAHATRTGHTATRRCLAAAAVSRPGGEYRKLLCQLGRTTVGTFDALPVLGSNQYLTVPLAFFAMKFVNRHAVILFARGQKLKPCDGA